MICITKDKKQMIKNKSKLHKGHRNRLRERFLKQGLENFQPHEIIELLLTYSIPRKDTNETAHNLIQTFGSFRSVLDSKPAFLKQVDGVGESSAVFLSMIGQICELYYSNNFKQTDLSNKRDIIDFCVNFMRTKKVEEVYMLCLDTSSTILNCVRLATGNPETAVVERRTPIEIAIQNKASQIVLTHNHPNRSADPSFNDDDFTQDIIQQMLSCGIDVIDHIIVGKDSFFSYQSYGFIDKMKMKVKPILR